MTQAAFPFLLVLLVWWSSTGVLIWLVGRTRATHKWTAFGVTLVMAAAMAGALALRDEASAIGAYLGFLAGLGVWAWHETMFLLGYICGPRRTPCPPDLAPWPRFLASAQTVIHHETAIALHAALLIALSWGAANQAAAATFALLWAMRVNAKLLVFLGAPNISDEFLPRHLSYLSTYFGKRRVTAFFPVFITLATAAATALSYAAATAAPSSFEATAFILLAALAWLAVLEHWALVLPLPDAALWRWATPSNQTSPAPAAATRDSGGTAHGL